MTRFTNPLQFNYIPYPLWRRHMADWFKPLVSPIYERIYPVAEDRNPPQTVEQMADYLTHYDLLSYNFQIMTLLKNSQAQIEHAPQHPNPVTYTDVIGDKQPSVRIPAQWETAEAILVNLPILYPPLWDLHAQMIEAIAPVAEVVVTVPSEMWAHGAWAYLKARGNLSNNLYKQVKFLVMPTDDIWVRDYGPIVGFNGNGHRVAVNAYYNRHEQYPQERDDGMVRYWSAHTETPILPLGLKTEGGNLLSDGQGTLFMSDGIYENNPQYTRAELDAHLHSIFDFEKLIITPRIPYESTGHVDLLVKLADAQTVFISAPNERTSRQQLRDTIDLFKRETNAHGQPYTIVELPTPSLYFNWFTYPIRRSYTNSLTVNGRILVPVYGIESDQRALEIYRETMPDYEIIPIDLKIGANGGGAVHCMTKEIPAMVATG